MPVIFWILAGVGYLIVSYVLVLAVLATAHVVKWALRVTLRGLRLAVTAIGLIAP